MRFQSTLEKYGEISNLFGEARSGREESVIFFHFKKHVLSINGFELPTFFDIEILFHVCFVKSLCISLRVVERWYHFLYRFLLTSSTAQPVILTTYSLKLVQSASMCLFWFQCKCESLALSILRTYQPEAAEISSGLLYFSWTHFAY